jgi:hypothetical protein
MKKIILFCCILLCVTKISIAQTGDPLILLELPEKTFMGATVEVTGASIKYEEYKNVKIVVTGPQNYAIDTLLPMDKEGNYFCIWEAPEVEGNYKFVMYSSDKKKTTTKSIKVELVVDIQEMGTENIASAKKAIATVEENMKSTKKLLSAKDAAELDKKFAAYKEDMDKRVAIYKQINEANKKVVQLFKSGTPMPPNVSKGLSDLQKALIDIKEKEKKATEYLSHKPTGYSICDALNGLKECLAAFGTITTFADKAKKGAIKFLCAEVKENIDPNRKFIKLLNKLPPSKIKVGENEKFALEQTKSIYKALNGDLSSMKSPIGIAGTASDFINYIADFLLKTYCGSFSGTVKQTYKFRNFNKSSEDWWIYTGILQGKITLRYPLATNTGNIIKMKGYIEGNATNFTFGADPKKAIRDDVSTEIYDHTKLIKIFEIKPPTVPFASAVADEKFELGFGARMLATPACFNILVDAEYNQETKEIKLFLNEATVDFTPAVKFRQLYGFLKYSLALELNYQDYPVAKAFKTFKKNLEDKNYFSVTIDANKNPSFKGNVKKKVNVVGQEIDLSFDVDAKKE